MSQDDNTKKDIKYRKAAEKVLKDVLRDAHYRKKDKKETKKIDLETLEAVVEEYLDCFILIGYNSEGEPVSIINAKTAQQADALSTSFNKMLMGVKPEFPGPDSEIEGF